MVWEDRYGPRSSRKECTFNKKEISPKTVKHYSPSSKIRHKKPNIFRYNAYLSKTKPSETHKKMRSAQPAFPVKTGSVPFSTQI